MKRIKPLSPRRQPAIRGNSSCSVERPANYRLSPFHLAAYESSPVMKTVPYPRRVAETKYDFDSRVAKREKRPSRLRGSKEKNDCNKFAIKTTFSFSFSSVNMSSTLPPFNVVSSIDFENGTRNYSLKLNVFHFKAFETDCFILMYFFKKGLGFSSCFFKAY